MIVKILQKHLDLIFDEINKNTPVIIYKNFFKANDCKKIISFCHKNNSYKNNRKVKVNKYFNFQSIDILPSNVQSSRILRSFDLSNFFINKFQSIKFALNFQKKIEKLEKNKKVFRKVQVFQYPRGGGFFEQHTHTRYPTNYGFIITLSQKNKDFKEGVTNFKVNGKNISLEKHNVNIGDLILFRFDLPHSISQCDPKEDLKFDLKGRWTLVLPVYHNKF